MTVCLRCDGCPKVISEQDDDFKTWWRLTRYGADWIEEPGAPALQMPMMPMMPMHPVFFDGQHMIEVDDDDGIEVEVLDDDEPSTAIVHFCSSACLAQWASQAAALEP